MRDRGFGWTVEMRVRALELGLRAREVAVRYRARQAGKSKISSTISGHGERRCRFCMYDRQIATGGAGCVV